MPLTQEVLSIQLRQGVSTKEDPKAVIAGKLLALENGSLQSPGSVRKRNGFAPKSRGVVGSATPITAGQALMTYRDELLQADPASLYSYDQSLDAWVSKGSFISAHVTQRSVVRNSYSQSTQDSATHASGLLVSAWEDSQGGVRYSAIDTATGVSLVADGVVDASGSRPKVLAIGNYCLIFFAKGTSLYYAPIAMATPQTLGSAVLLSSALTASLVYDAEVVGQRVMVAWATSSGWSALYLTSTLIVIPKVDVSTTTPTALSVFADSVGQNVVFAWYDGTAIRAQIRDYSLASVVSATATIETLANVVSVTGIAIPGSTSSLRFFYSVSAASPSNYLTRTATVAGYGAATAAAYLRSVALAGKPFVYNGTAYVPLAFSSTLQSTYFVADSSGNLVAKILAGLGGGIPTRCQLAESNHLGGTQWQLSFLAKDLLTVTGGAVATLTGVSSVTLDMYDQFRAYSRAELGLGLHIGGGFLALYDGAGVVEHGFHLYPEGVTTALTDPDTGTTQVYQYAVCYEWTDNQGQIHRSAPSIAVTQKKATTIDGTHRVTVTIPTLRLTAKQNGRRRAQCVVYRTISNGTIFYQATTVASPIYNDVTADTVTFTDSVTDSTLIGNPQLYTTGEVENIAPNPLCSLTVHQNRIVGLDSTNPLQLWWSKPVIPGSPVEFSDLFVQNIDPVGGDITAIARMDAWLIIFKRSAIFATNEDGPSANGGTYVFTSGTQIPADVGCVNPRSVNLGADGITFQSAKGWHLLNRSLQVEDIPDTDAWANDSATSALTMPGTHETRFSLSSGVFLVHDDFLNQWGTYTNCDAVDSVIWQGVHTYLRSDGQVRQETPGVFSDAGMPIKLRIRTSWLQFAGVSGYQRIRSLTVLGDYLSPHTLVASVAVDFNPEPVQVFTIDATGELGQPVYGGDSVYGGANVPSDSLVYGGTWPGYSWRLNLSTQKCTSLQLTLEDSQTGPIGEGCSFASIAAMVGLKPGTRRLPASRQA